MDNISPGTRQLLNFSMLPNVGPKLLLRVLQVDGIDNLHYEKIIERIPELGFSRDKIQWNTACELAEDQIAQSEKLGIRILSSLDPDYPELLCRSNDDPCLLWVKGNLPKNTLCVAIIGPREPTNHGKLITERISQFFVTQGWSVISGLALGCDTTAHESALAHSGHTVAVMAHGLQMVSPSANKELSERILSSGGALVSEYPLGFKAKSHQFVKRDRTQAGLSQGVVMVQSDLKGGSLHAPRAALDYRRWVAVPYPTIQDRSEKALKIQANLLICHGTDEDKTQLLRCSKEALNLIRVINSKEDYPSLVAPSLQDPLPLDHFQPPLI